MKKIKLDLKTLKDIDSFLKPFRLKADTYADRDDKGQMVIAYEHFSKLKSAYKVAELYNVKVCPYCNINYTYTVAKHCRPDFDHFLPKSKHPNLALRTFNLIPCCQQCNSRLKGPRETTLKTHLHPYRDDFDSLAEFVLILNSGMSLDQVKKESDFCLECVSKSTTSATDKTRVKGNCDLFAINERYQFHKNEIVKLVNNAYDYMDGFLMEILNFFNVSGSSQTDALKQQVKQSKFAQKYIFPDIDCDINSTSLGKMKRDISEFILKNWI